MKTQDRRPELRDEISPQGQEQRIAQSKLFLEDDSATSPTLVSFQRAYSE